MSYYIFILIYIKINSNVKQILPDGYGSNETPST